MTPLLALALWLTPARAAPVAELQAAAVATWQGESALRAAIHAELDRARQLTLGEEGPPWFVAVDVTQGVYSTWYAELGGLLSEDGGPHRQARVEVRVGDVTYDSGNFDAMGQPDGIVGTGLPLEDVELALRHELWLAIDQGYKDAVEQIARKRAEVEPTALEAPELVPVEPATSGPSSPAALDPDGLRERVQRLSAVLADTPELESGAAAGRDWQGVRVTVTTEGTELSRPTGYAVVRVEAVMKHADGSRLRDGRWWVAATVRELPPVGEMEAEVRQMAAWLVGLKDAPVLEDWLGPVLFEGPAATEVFRQLVAPELVGTPPMREQRGPFGDVPDPRPTARVGRRLLPLGWSVVDDPGAKAPGAYTHDHEGVPGERVEVVQDGVVRELLMTRVPRDADDRSTGHARSLGVGRREAMPSNVQVDPPRSSSLRRLERRGLRLASAAGLDALLVIGRLEPPAMTEDFDVYFTGDGPPPGLTPPFEAWLLRADGTREPVRGATFHGVDRRLLRDIEGAGPMGAWVGVLDAGAGPQRYTLGAVGGLPAAWRVPPILVTEVELRGRSGGEVREIPRPELRDSLAE